MGKAVISNETIVLRARGYQNDLLSTFSAKTKETRLTAFLSYLFFLGHPGLLNLFRIYEQIEEVWIEYSLDRKRADIIVITLNDAIIIEAKLYFNDPADQLYAQFKKIKKKRLFENKKIKLFAITQCHFEHKKKINYICWDEIKSALSNSKLLDSRHKIHKILGEEMVKHMVNQGLANQKEKFEVYARDMNGEFFLRFYLKGWIYFCKAENNNNIEKCSYFAPYFGQKIARDIPGIQEGIAYISKIKSVQYVKKGDIVTFKRIIKQHNRTFYNKIVKDPVFIKMEITQNMKVLLLDKPQLLFNPPIQKRRLIKGAGWLGKKYFTLTELLDAWSTGK